MDPAALAILCLILGLMLIAAEFFIPSGGVIGLFATIAIIVSIYEANQAFSGSQPGLFYAFLLLVFVAVPGTAIAMFKMLRNSPRGEELFLTAPVASELSAFDETGRHLAELVGRFGVAVSDLQPSGIARVDGERLDVVSEGTLVESGTPIKVIGVRSVYPIVRAADQDEVDAFLAAATRAEAVDTFEGSDVEDRIDAPAGEPADESVLDPLDDPLTTPSDTAEPSRPLADPSPAATDGEITDPFAQDD